MIANAIVVVEMIGRHTRIHPHTHTPFPFHMALQNGATLRLVCLFVAVFPPLTGYARLLRGGYLSFGSWARSGSRTGGTACRYTLFPLLTMVGWLVVLRTSRGGHESLLMPPLLLCGCL